ncbi:MAG: carbon-nitrogen hydrolase family protein [Thaumarchaeota archaeon]|nr:carbon-nitrogen hydrolase family protein [Nitrososphaerota archaeon]
MTTIAIAQLKASTDKQKNLKKIENFVYQATKKGARLCAFPEFMMFYTPSGQSAKELASLAETINGEFVSSVAEYARQNSIQIVGTFYEKSQKPNRVYDTSFIVNEQGKVISKYRKIHLFDALGFKESKKLLPGSKIVKPTTTTLGKTGMMICYDLRFPEISRTLALLGTEFIVVPSAWVKGEMKEDHWITINKTRAIENGCYLIAPDQVGNIYCGRSLVVDPYGKILLDMKKREGIGIVKVSAARVKQVRNNLPLLKNRRTDIYTNF